ncbi:hypothetical protein T10_5772 [Trichinella papuae]|uniref:Uncharacterized protein n=1 Tax=Trichinella papuae TaxID=268474 RepID=A0A0V1MZ63_9BILA|nr:hypothetical protein T10_5772 [Trichinella papuae]
MAPIKLKQNSTSTILAHKNVTKALLTYCRVSKVTPSANVLPGALILSNLRYCCSQLDYTGNVGIFLIRKKVIYSRSSLPELDEKVLKNKANF